MQDPDKLWDEFRNIVKHHVVGIGEEQYQSYIEQGKCGVSIYPSSDAYRGFGMRSSRYGLVDMAISESGIEAAEYFDLMLKKQHEVIDRIDIETTLFPVYFFPDLGSYAIGVKSRVLEVWLSWPAYPKGW